MSDLTQKKEANNNASSTGSSTEAVLPKSKNGRGELLSQVAKEASQKNLSPQGPSAKEKLIDSYLKGEISLGEMTYKLKVFNSVVADTVLRDSKDSGALQINSEDASKIGSGISKAGLAKALEEGKEEKSHALEKDSEDEAKERQIQKREEKKEAQEKEQIIVRANLFDQESKDIKRAQRWREVQKLEKEEAEEYQDRKLEEELLVASEERKNALAKAREMKIKGTSTKHGVTESTSGGGEKAGR